MCAAFIIAALLPEVGRNTFSVLVGGAVAVLLGVADDKWELRPRTKFLEQLLPPVRSCSSATCVSGS